MTPPGAARLRPLLDELAADAWPALEQVVVDGWRLRAAEGVTRRANSALPLGDPVELDQQLQHVRRFYGSRGLPAQVQVSDPGLDAELAARGWRRHTPTVVMTGRLLPGAAAAEVDLSDRPTDDWTRCWWAVDGRGGDRELEVALGCLAGIRAATSYAVVRRDGSVVASGRAVAQQGWLGVFAMAVLPGHRRSGCGRLLLAALAAWGAEAGASRLYLQVAEDNTGARALYGTSGLLPAYGYAYRTAPTEQDLRP